jgi:hypothetical protein
MRPRSWPLHFVAITTGQEAASWLRRLFCLFTALASFIVVVCSASISYADEGGVSFWIPGLYGSLAAAPQVPGWAVGIIDLYNPVSAGGNVAAARQVTINGFKGTVNVNLNATLKANPNLILVAPTYVFATPVLGGQFALSMAGAYGRSYCGNQRHTHSNSWSADRHAPRSDRGRARRLQRPLP